MSLITLYELGFDKLNELSEEDLSNFNAVREAEVKYLMEKQFLLSYLGNISKQDSDNMTPFELDNWFELLKKQKELETEK